MKEFNLPEFQVSKEDHTFRQNCHAEAARSLKASWESFDKNQLDNLSIEVTLSRAIPSASDPRWAKRHFGAVNTVQKSGCLAMVSKLVLDFFGQNIPMEDILTQIEEKGYRQWKLEKSKTLTLPKIELASLKAAYPKNDPIQGCNSLKEVFALYGKPIGIGGSMFFMDQLIGFLSEKPIEVYKDTRIKSIEQLISNLEHGFIVPLRVNNSIYHADKEKVGGHYLSLVGLFGREALLADSSKSLGFHLTSAERLFEAMLADDDLICAWDVSPCKRA